MQANFAKMAMTASSLLALADGVAESASNDIERGEQTTFVEKNLQISF